MNKSEFIVGNKYVVNNHPSRDTDPHRKDGLVITARYDDGTYAPKFTLPTGMLDDLGDDWAYFNREYVEPYTEPTTTPTPLTSESIQPFVVMGLGTKWHILKPSGERVNVYFNTTKAAFAVAKTLAEVYHA